MCYQHSEAEHPPSIASLSGSLFFVPLERPGPICTIKFNDLVLEVCFSVLKRSPAL